VSNIQALYTEVPRRWQQYVFSKEPIQTPISAAALGDDAGVVGAALLAAGY
jgi:fructokinase